ncbi:hypothetical protein [Streptomyces sp. NPDC020917]|uniref:hypothetical protein n=1 Tax=Streptomyces sp. NPDC020917 TaxID=3365102 RepID=UPI0037AA072D
MSESAVVARREQFTEKLAELDGPKPRFGVRAYENSYTRFNPGVMLVLALVICVGITLVYRGGGNADSHERAVRLMVGLAFWVVPFVLVVMPVGVRYLLRRSALRRAAAGVPRPGTGLALPAAVDGRKGLLVAEDGGLALHTAEGTRQPVAAWKDIAVACEFTPRHPLWSLAGTDLRMADGTWVEIRAAGVRPLLNACRDAGVRVLPAVNAADLRNWGGSRASA